MRVRHCIDVRLDAVVEHRYHGLDLLLAGQEDEDVAAWLLRSPAVPPPAAAVSLAVTGLAWARRATLLCASPPHLCVDVHHRLACCLEVVDARLLQVVDIYKAAAHDCS